LLLNRLFTLSIFIFFLGGKVFPSTETDLLSTPSLVVPLISQKKDCADCAFLKEERDVECPKVIDHLIQLSLSNTLYNMVIGKKILDICFSSLAPSTNSNERNEVLLSQFMGEGSYRVPQDTIRACLASNKINFNDVNTSKSNIQKVITGYLFTLQKNISDKHISQLEQMAVIDSLLGRSPIAHLQCGTEFEKTCQKIKTCKPNNTLNEMTTFSINALTEMNKLKMQLNDLIILNRKNKINTADLILAKKDINNKIKMILDLIPWFRGDELAPALISISKKIENNKNAEAQNEFKEKFKNQLNKAYVLIKENNNLSGLSYDCLKNNSGCSSKILDHLNSFITHDYSKKNINVDEVDAKSDLSRTAFIESRNANQSLRSGFCVGEQLKSKEEVDKLASIVASTGIGLVIGGAGGVLELGKTALNFYRAGHLLKGITSIGVLSAEGVNIKQSYTDVAHECEKALHHLEEARFKESKKNSECPNNLFSFEVTKLSSCLVDISLTTLPSLLTLRPLRKGANLKTDKKIISQDLLKENKPILFESFVNKKMDQYEKIKFQKIKEKLISAGKSESAAIREAEMMARASKDSFKNFDS
jgi:hypothetical protein